jgi:hypothetical protein
VLVGYLSPSLGAALRSPRFQKPSCVVLRLLEEGTATQSKTA